MLTSMFAVAIFGIAASPEFARRQSQLQLRTPAQRKHERQGPDEQVPQTKHIAPRCPHGVSATSFRGSIVPRQKRLIRTVHHTHSERFYLRRTNKTQLIRAALIRLFSSACSQGAFCCLAVRSLWECLMQEMPLQWVTIDRYAELVGTTRDAVRALIKKGKIALEVHWTKCDGRIYINVPAMQKRISQGGV